MRLQPLDDRSTEHLATVAQQNLMAMEIKSTAGGLCLYAAFASLMAAAHLEIPAMFMAGSMSWRFVPPDLDDGVSPTHFSYMWNDNPTAESQANHRAIQKALEMPEAQLAAFIEQNNGFRQNLPECHCWVGLPLDNKVFDLTTGAFQEQSARAGLKGWRTPSPPKYYFGPGMANGDIIYAPNPDATTMMFHLGLRILGLNQPIMSRLIRKHLRDTVLFLSQRISNN